MSADLSKIPFADLLWSASAGRRSGDLVLEHEEVRRTLVFDQGRLVSASSALERDRLGEFLLAQGGITATERTRAEESVRAGRHRRFVDALVAEANLTRQDLGRLVGGQVKQIVLSLFKLNGGAARFSEGEPSVEVDQMVGVSLHRLLYVGIRSMHEPELILAGLGDLDRDVVLAPDLPFRFVLRKCPPGEIRILQEAREPTILRHLASEADRLSPAKLKAVYALYASGVIEDVTGPEGLPTLKPVEHIETNTFLLSSHHEVDLPDADGMRQEVDQELAFSDRLDVSGWIRLATRKDVVRALGIKLDRYLRFLGRAGDDPDLKLKLEALIGRITIVLSRFGEDPVRQVQDASATQTIPPHMRALCTLPDADPEARRATERRPKLKTAPLSPPDTG